MSNKRFLWQFVVVVEEVRLEPRRLEVFCSPSDAGRHWLKSTWEENHTKTSIIERKVSIQRFRSELVDVERSILSNLSSSAENVLLFW